MAVCPKCKGSDFDQSIPWHNKEIHAVHLRCKNCKTILWTHKDPGYSEHGYCGFPAEHWLEYPTDEEIASTIEEIKKHARDRVKVKDSGIPF